jgi:hypothetical protein
MPVFIFRLVEGCIRYPQEFIRIYSIVRILAW